MATRLSGAAASRAAAVTVSHPAVLGGIAVGDQLVGVTAVRIMGGKYERRMYDTHKWDFDVVRR